MIEKHKDYAVAYVIECWYFLSDIINNLFNYKVDITNNFSRAHGAIIRKVTD